MQRITTRGTLRSPSILTEKAVPIIWQVGSMKRSIAHFYRATVKEVGLKPAWPEALPDGVLAARRGTFVFVQNCNEHPVEVGGVALNRYGTAVWKNGEQVL